MWFKKQSSVSRSVAGGGVLCNELYDAKDTIASILATLSEFSLPTKALDRDEFVRRCDELSREILVKAVEGRDPRPLSECFRDVRHTVRQQRRIESSEYLAQKQAGKVLVEELVKNLEEALEARKRDDQEVMGLLDEVMTAVESGDLVRVKQCAADAASRIREIVERQRMTEQARVMDLSHKLAVMRQELETVKEEAERDHLTDLLNRRSFDIQLENTLRFAGMSGVQVALFMIDLDDFKKINDTYGHQVGDDVLKKVAMVVEKSFLRKDDVVARYGGEELAVICRDVTEANAYVLAQRVRKSVERLDVHAREASIKVTISVGWAVSGGELTESEFVRQADKALYEAKAAGKNCVRPEC